MKKIYNILFAATALFAFAPFMSAQDVPFPADNTITFSQTEWSKQYTIDEDSGVAYRKIISKPNTQGVYHIMLEAFVTGREIKLQKSLPADIVLVLDVSGSMGYPFDFTARESQSYSYNSYGSNQYYYLHTNGIYYLVQQQFVNNTGTQSDRYRLRYQVGNTWWYLSGTGSTTTAPNNNSASDTIFTGTLYVMNSSETRLSAMKTAVKTFIDLINTNDLENAPQGRERLGNRIAIVPFQSNTTTSGNNQIRNFRTLDQANAMKTNIDNLQASGGTNAHLGMQQALTYLTNSTSQLKTVVLFTDGDPGTNGDWTTTDTWTSANSTIDYADQIKKLAVESDNPEDKVIANVFTVSIIPEPKPYTEVYLGATSSNWKTATSMGSSSNWNSTDIWANVTGTRNTYTDDEGTHNETKYALTASNAAQLEEAFATIAEDSGGSSDTLGESSVSTVDVVSASFMLPTGTQPSNIRVYTSPCTSVASSGQPSFGTMILAKNRTDTYQPMKKENGQLVPDGNPKDVDDAINPRLDGNMITIDGFDFSNLWVGEVVENGVHVDWHGYKMTILIPIKMNPDALGGVGVDTNGEGSGIFIDGKNEFPFISPVVNLPVNIIINKQGLKEGESSKFTILRKTASETTWEEVTSVFVTRHKNQGENDPRTRIEGLPATNASGVEYIYKVREDDWSWSYTLTSDRELTTEDNDNPFTFHNSPKTNIDTKIRHAESKATNTFTTGGTATYDDSKNNNRTVITAPPTTPTNQ